MINCTDALLVSWLFACLRNWFSVQLDRIAFALFNGVPIVQLLESLFALLFNYSIAHWPSCIVARLGKWSLGAFGGAVEAGWAKSWRPRLENSSQARRWMR
jgi:hypothetical protein